MEIVKKFALILSLAATPCFADATMEIVSGNITEHYMGDVVAKHYANQIGDNGKLINNPMFGLRYTLETENQYWSAMGFGGQNSVGFGMAGLTISAGTQTRHFRLGVIGGAYIQNNDYVRWSGVNPDYTLEPIAGIGIAPVLGIEANARVFLSDDVFAGVNAIITPVLATAFVNIGWLF